MPIARARSTTAASDLNTSKQWFAENTNPERLTGSLAEVMPGADVFIGLSGPNLITRDDVQSRWRSDPIVFAMANPDPEIRPELISDVAAVIATGRSDFPNQINNVLAFPGIFRGALDAGARKITENMKVAAADAIASVRPADDLRARLHHPVGVRQPRWRRAVAAACAEAAGADGVVSRVRDLSAGARPLDAVTFDFWNTLVAEATPKAAATALWVDAAGVDRAST